MHDPQGTTRPTWERGGCGGGEPAKLQHSNWRGGEYIDGGDDNGGDGTKNKMSLLTSRQLTSDAGNIDDGDADSNKDQLDNCCSRGDFALFKSLMLPSSPP